MAKAELAQIDLYTGQNGLAAYCNGKLLGRVDVCGDQLVIYAMMRQTQGDVVLPEALAAPTEEGQG